MHVLASINIRIYESDDRNKQEMSFSVEQIDRIKLGNLGRPQIRVGTTFDMTFCCSIT